MIPDGPGQPRLAPVDPKWFRSARLAPDGPERPRSESGPLGLRAGQGRPEPVGATRGRPGNSGVSRDSRGKVGAGRGKPGTTTIKNPYYRNKNGNLVRDQFSFTKDQIAFKDADNDDQKTYNQSYVDKLNEDKNKATNDAYNSGFSNGYNAALRQFQSMLYNSHQTVGRQPFQSNQIAYYNDNSDLNNDNLLNYNFNPRFQNSYFTQPQNDFIQSQNNFNQPRNNFSRNPRRNRGNGRRFTPRR